MGLRAWGGLLVGLAAWAAAAGPAAACGGFFCMNQPMDQAAERIAFFQEGGQVAAHVQVSYSGSAADFSWVVPTPTQPKLEAGSEALFEALEQGTTPRFELELQDLGDCEEIRYRMMEGAPRPAAPMAQRADGGVTVLERREVGPYDTAVLHSNDPGALKAWLRRNRYVVPPRLDPLLDPYVAGGYYFVALKLKQDREAGDLQPIVLKYAATKPGIPIRLTAVAATPDMDIRVWMLGAHRAVPENYRHVRINEQRVDWLSGGSNYKQVVSKAVDEAGGQAFVTDYAGPTSVVPRRRFEGLRADLDLLRSATDPVGFVETVQRGGWFLPGSPSAMAFVKRHAPLRAHAEAPDRLVYSFPRQYSRHFVGKVDTKKAVAELLAQVVVPAEAVGKALAGAKTLTRLYTTMSAQEMTQDPLFVTNAGLGGVPLVRKAKGLRDCRKVKEAWRAPVTITLSDGRRFTVTPTDRFPRPFRGGVRPQVTPPGELQAEAPGAGPFAAVVEQLRPEGPAFTITDHRADLVAAADPGLRATTAPGRTGFGCSAVQAAGRPWSEGSGELGLGALAVGGLWGLSRRRRRPR